MQNELKNETLEISTKVQEIQNEFDTKYDKYLKSFSKNNEDSKNTWELNAIKRKIEIEKKKIEQNNCQIKIIEESIKKNDMNLLFSKKKEISNIRESKNEETYNKNIRKILEAKSPISEKNYRSGFVWNKDTEKTFAKVLDESKYDFNKAIILLGKELNTGSIWTANELREKWTEIYLKKQNNYCEKDQKENIIKVNDFDELD